MSRVGVLAVREEEEEGGRRGTAAGTGAAASASGRRGGNFILLSDSFQRGELVKASLGFDWHDQPTI